MLSCSRKQRPVSAPRHMCSWLCIEVHNRGVICTVKTGEDTGEDTSCAPPSDKSLVVHAELCSCLFTTAQASRSMGWSYRQALSCSRDIALGFDENTIGCAGRGGDALAQKWQSADSRWLNVAGHTDRTARTARNPKP